MNIKQEIFEFETKQKNPENTWGCSQATSLSLLQSLSVNTASKFANENVFARFEANPNSFRLQSLLCLLGVFCTIYSV